MGQCILVVRSTKHIHSQMPHLDAAFLSETKNICDVTQQFSLHFLHSQTKWLDPPHIYNLQPSTKHRSSDTTKQNLIYIITDTAKHKLTPPHIYNLHRLQNIDRRQSNIITQAMYNLCRPMKHRNNDSTQHLTNTPVTWRLRRVGVRGGGGAEGVFACQEIP